MNLTLETLDMMESPIDGKEFWTGFLGGMAAVGGVLAIAAAGAAIT